MPRFVILEHDHPFLHWDLMLEAGSVLRTWRLRPPPRRGEAIVATAVFEHRLLYLDYEGPISGGRGRVLRWEHGTYTGRVQGEEESSCISPANACEGCCVWNTRKETPGPANSAERIRVREGQGSQSVTSLRPASGSARKARNDAGSLVRPSM